MAAILTCVITGATWCFCTAAASLLGSCCGNDKPSTVAPGAASGRKRSVLLLILTIAVAFALQYGVAPYIVQISISNYVTTAWLSGCDDFEMESLIENCAGQAGVYRAALAAVVFFILAAIAVSCKRTANREAWPAKYVLYLFLVAGLCFVPNEPLFTSIYLNIARIGACLFILFQQVVFVDLAHNWNDGWVEKADQAEREEIGSGKKWLMAILASAMFLFIVSLVGWVLLFYFFGGCSTNIAFITVTIILALLVIIASLWGTEGSLLSSSLISAYATMLCYSAVARNPDTVCNPQLGEDDALSIVIGVGLTVVSLGYVGWSTTADRTLGGKRNGGEEQMSEVEQSQAPTEGEKAKVSGVVANYETHVTKKEGTEDAEEDGVDEGPVPNSFSNNWKLNVALTVVTCFFSMAVTGWGSIQANGNVADPQVGKVNMWIIIASQWVALMLYAWTLVAPRLFPDRDFS
jgi:serine incorporator 1/3